MSPLTLILNASEGRLQFLFAEGATLLCAQEWSAPSKGTELLTPALAEAFKLLHIEPAILARIACVAGPGSFTGLRLALTTASAFRHALGIPLASLNTLQALAASIPVMAPMVVRVLTHARRGLVHGQDFLIRPNALPSPLCAPDMWDLEVSGAPVCAELRAPHCVIGSGVSRNFDHLRAVFPESTILFSDLNHPTSNALLALTLDLPDNAWQHQDIDPLYLRPCDAVDNLDTIAARRGQSPQEAHEKLRALLEKKHEPQ